jgi:hypothetical protein
MENIVEKLARGGVMMPHRAWQRAIGPSERPGD